MLEPTNFLENLLQQDVGFFSGVPDSLLKEFCACVTDVLPSNSHVIAANEGGAIGLAIGYHLGTGKVPLVYLQNSGLGNVVNPLLSLASPKVYGVPMLILIGWRGEPGVKDEPQHVHQGAVMLDMLEAMDIHASVLSAHADVAKRETIEAIKTAKETSSPVALVARKGLFAEYALGAISSDYSMTREDAIRTSASAIEESAIVIATTGMASRELFEYRSCKNLGHGRDFLTVGGMGHASQIALGVAMTDIQRPVYCFDGDGALLMHLGSLAIIGQSGCQNYTHLVFNNGVHASVGGQPTVGFEVDFCDMAKAAGYAHVLRVDSKSELFKVLSKKQANLTGPTFIEVRTRPENRNGIGRPTQSPAENKNTLMKFLRAGG